MTESKKVLNLFQRINAVRDECHIVTKAKEVGYGKNVYKVATHEDVNTMLKPLLIKHGLTDFVSLHKRTMVDTGKRVGQNNVPVMRYEGRFVYTIVNVDNPEDRLAILIEGHGEDSADKGPGKATTYAFKTGRAKMFSITTGEDEEGRIPDEDLVDPSMKAITPDQLDELLKLSDELFGADEADVVLGSLATNLYGVKAAKDIPVQYFQQAQDWLKKKANVEKKGEPESL